MLPMEGEDKDSVKLDLVEVEPTPKAIHEAVSGLSQRCLGPGLDNLGFFLRSLCLTWVDFK